MTERSGRRGFSDDLIGSACDPYPCWFYWTAAGELVQGSYNIAWADGPKPFGRKPCGFNGRLNSWSNYCVCQGWCL